MWGVWVACNMVFREIFGGKFPVKATISDASSKSEYLKYFLKSFIQNRFTSVLKSEDNVGILGEVFQEWNWYWCFNILKAIIQN